VPTSLSCLTLGMVSAACLLCPRRWLDDLHTPLSLREVRRAFSRAADTNFVGGLGTSPCAELCDYDGFTYKEVILIEGLY